MSAISCLHTIHQAYENTQDNNMCLHLTTTKMTNKTYLNRVPRKTSAARLCTVQIARKKASNVSLYGAILETTHPPGQISFLLPRQTWRFSIITQSDASVETIPRHATFSRRELSTIFFLGHHGRFVCVPSNGLGGNRLRKIIPGDVLSCHLVCRTAYEVYLC